MRTATPIASGLLAAAFLLSIASPAAGAAVEVSAADELAVVVGGPTVQNPTITWDGHRGSQERNVLFAVLGTDANPAASGTISDPAATAGGTSSFDAADYDVSIVSSDSAVVANDSIVFIVDSNGRFSLEATPAAVGTASIAIAVTSKDDARVGTSNLDYRVAASRADDSAVTRVGLTDTSAARDSAQGARAAGGLHGVADGRGVSGALAGQPGAGGSLASTGGEDLASIGFAAVALLLLAGAAFLLRSRFHAEEHAED